MNYLPRTSFSMVLGMLVEVQNILGARVTNRENKNEWEEITDTHRKANIVSTILIVTRI